jgi:hypothetical protein
MNFSDQAQQEHEVEPNDSLKASLDKPIFIE